MNNDIIKIKSIGPGIADDEINKEVEQIIDKTRVPIGIKGKV
jgi:hypothetical protein